MGDGITQELPVLTFTPYNEYAMLRSPALLDWLRSWSGTNTPLLSPEDWFTKGHDLEGGYFNKRRFWINRVKLGTYIWNLSPAAADVALEQIRIARIKRQKFTHIRCLLTCEWLKQMQKISDFYIEIPSGSVGWSTNMYETLLLAVALPFIRHPSWQIRGTPKVCQLVRELHKIFKEEALAAGIF